MEHVVGVYVKYCHLCIPALNVSLVFRDQWRFTQIIMNMFAYSNKRMLLHIKYVCVDLLMTYSDLLMLFKTHSFSVHWLGSLQFRYSPLGGDVH